MDGYTFEQSHLTLSKIYCFNVTLKFKKAFFFFFYFNAKPYLINMQSFSSRKLRTGQGGELTKVKAPKHFTNTNHCSDHKSLHTLQSARREGQMTFFTCLLKSLWFSLVWISKADLCMRQTGGRGVVVGAIFSPL